MSTLISVVDRRKQASRVSSTILFRVLLFIRSIIEKALSQMYVLPNMEHIFCAKSLSGETALCLQAPKTSRNALFFFFEKRKGSDCNLHNSCEDKVVETLHLLLLDC